jgi:hypothetical protein
MSPFIIYYIKKGTFSLRDIEIKYSYLACKDMVCMIFKPLILAKQTGYFAPGCKFNVESTDVLSPFRPVAENSSHPLCGW